MKEPDSLLVRACRSGDREAWETLVRRYERLVYAVPIRCGLNSEDAADVFQTVWLRLVQNLDKIQDEKHLTGWLITTARREAWRISRRSGREVTGAEESTESGAAEELESREPLPHTEVERLEEEQLVRSSLEELGERCRILLRWLYQTDPTPAYTEIARRLNVSVGAIGPTRARCLQQLKKSLQKRGF